MTGDAQTLGLVELEVHIGGDVRRVELDLDPNRLTLRETVRLERVLGPDLGGLRGAAGADVEVTMALVQALIWSKLCSVLPEPIGLDDFDIELGAIEPNSTPPPPSPDPEISAERLEAHLFAGGPDPMAPAARPKV